MNQEMIKFLLKQSPIKILKRLNTLSVNKFCKILKIKNDKKNQIPKNYISPSIAFSYIDINLLNTSALDSKLSDYLMKQYLDHRFDLLGSGWIQYKYSVLPLGIENVKFKIPEFCFKSEKDILPNIVPDNFLQNSVNIWRLIDKNYHPIDWQRDYKSGYRWNSKKDSSTQRKNLPEGADLKMPWELSRMQFLPQLSLFAIKHPEYKEKIITEFKNIVLDFIATNIPNYGVNWICTMDVGIRAANILFSHDVLKQLDSQNILNKNFSTILQKSIFEHGLFITNNLEFSEIITSNHYLSNICGLLFITSYLEKEKYTNAWLVFSIQELLKEIPKQFYIDGGNFEASTSYHRLSSEMLLYSYALLQQVIDKKKGIFENIEKIPWKVRPNIKWRKVKEIPKKINNKAITQLLYNTGTFTASILKNNGEIPQFGDNDSGRFLKFSPTGEFITNEEAEKKYHNLIGYTQIISESKESIYFDENILDHRTLLAAFSGLFNDNVFSSCGNKLPLERSIVSALASGKIVSVKSNKNLEIQSKEKTHKLIYSKTFTHNFIKNVEIENINVKIYPDFGIAVFKSTTCDFFLSVFMGNNGQNGLGGHSHNDKLSFELYHNGKNIFIDPGTYLYTPFPEIRNKFRTVKAHNNPTHGNFEIDDFKYGRIGVFRMFDNHKCKILFANNNTLKVSLKYKNVIHIREFVIQKEKLIINDLSNHDFSQSIVKPLKYSNGYGKLTKHS